MCFCVCLFCRFFIVFFQLLFLGGGVNKKNQDITNIFKSFIIIISILLLFLKYNITCSMINVKRIMLYCTSSIPICAKVFSNLYGEFVSSNL